MELLILSGIVLGGSILEALLSTLFAEPHRKGISEDDGLDDRYIRLASETYGVAEPA